MQPFQWKFLWITRREKREILSTPSSAIIFHTLTLLGQAVDQNPLDGFWQTDRTSHKKLPVSLRSRGTDPHPAAGVDRFSPAPPPPCPTHLSPSRVLTADPCEGHVCNSNLPEDETLHWERARTITPGKGTYHHTRAIQKQHQSLIQLKWHFFRWPNLLYFCLVLNDTRLILYRSQ